MKFIKSVFPLENILKKAATLNLFIILYSGYCIFIYYSYNWNLLHIHRQYSRHYSGNIVTFTLPPPLAKLITFTTLTVFWDRSPNYILL